MHKIENYNQIRQFMSNVRSLRKGFVTNFYWDEKKHPYWIDNGDFYFMENENCVLLVHKNKTFHNLYFIATSHLTAATAIKRYTAECDLVIDFVCKGPGLVERDIFKSVGFEDYKDLYRMSHTGVMAEPDWGMFEDVSYGDIGDAISIQDVFQKDFDPLCEQLPSLNEIEDFINRKQILVVKEGNKLCGFIIFEITGVTWYLRYWYTSPMYRNKGIGAKLIRTALSIGKDTKRQLFWVLSENENAIKRYEHFGFKREDMNDYVIIKYK